MFPALTAIGALAAVKLVKFYNEIGRDLTSQNIRWNPIIKDFIQQWKALERREKEESVEVPKISKALPILKWTEAMADYFNRIVGVRKIHRRVSKVVLLSHHSCAYSTPLSSNLYCAHCQRGYWTYTISYLT